MSDYSELKKLAEAATPQDFDSAEEKVENGYIECPHCGGSGEVELEADYCNYDNAAIGVQFYGIGHEFGAAEAYYRGARPAVVLALIADLNALAAQRDEGLAREAELQSLYEEERDSRCKLAEQRNTWRNRYEKLRKQKHPYELSKEIGTLQQRLAEAENMLRWAPVPPWASWARDTGVFLSGPRTSFLESPSVPKYETRWNSLGEWSEWKTVDREEYGRSGGRLFERRVTYAPVSPDCADGEKAE